MNNECQDLELSTERTNRGSADVKSLLLDLHAKLMVAFISFKDQDVWNYRLRLFQIIEQFQGSLQSSQRSAKFQIFQDKVTDLQSHCRTLQSQLNALHLSFERQNQLLDSLHIKNQELYSDNVILAEELNTILNKQRQQLRQELVMQAVSQGGNMFLSSLTHFTRNEVRESMLIYLQRGEQAV